VELNESPCPEVDAARNINRVLSELEDDVPLAEAERNET
jgi:hypothetical protein